MATHTGSVEGDVVAQVTEWFKGHRRLVTAVAATLAIGGGAVWFTISARQRKENFAARELGNAQAALAAANTALATSDLARLTATYGGTAAANEAAILLGQLRLSGGQTDSAVNELQRFVRSGPPPRFAGAAYHLLGAAEEQAGHMAEAAQAYRKAADIWPYHYLQAQALLDAGRAFRAAGDSLQAIAAYDRILRDFSKSPSVVEAKVRLGELRQGSSPPS